MQAFQRFLELGPTFDLNVGNYNIQPSYVQAGVIVFLLFLLVLTLARLRHMYVSWSLSGVHLYVLMGFILAIICEGFLLIGGNTFLTRIMGVRNAPKPIQMVLDSGRNHLIKVLGATDEAATVQSVMFDYEGLDTVGQSQVKAQVCGE